RTKKTNKTNKTNKTRNSRDKISDLINTLTYLAITETHPRALTSSKIFVSNLATLPQYKFFTPLVLKIISYSRKLGSPLAKALFPIKQGIIADHKFERQISSELAAAHWQFAFTAVLTWIFIYASNQLISPDFLASTTTDALHTPQLHSIANLLPILITQFLGLACFWLLYKRMNQALFAPFTRYFECLYTLYSLSLTSLPWPSILQELQQELKELFASSCKGLQSVKDRLQLIIELAQSVGGKLDEELQEAIQETCFQQGERYQYFLKWCKILKLLITAVFFLGPYFYFLFLLFSYYTKW
ncbi:MAG: hypothetical protein HQK53_12325, partial [Oligoflexia bacterium]|nr:hypothetical protein [Oligoflexia bacterium]